MFHLNRLLKMWSEVEGTGAIVSHLGCLGQEGTCVYLIGDLI